MIEGKRLVGRSYLQKLISKKDSTDIIKIVTGVRRCGKSTLLKQYSEYLTSSGVSADDIFYVNLELHGNSRLRDSDAFYSFLRKNLIGRRTYLMVDEVQLMDGWEAAVNSALAEFDADIYLTGSNAYMLSTELSTLISGRYVEIGMLPLSFAEFLDLNGIDPEKADDGHLALYVSRGSMPSILPSDTDVDVRDKLEGIYNTVVAKDIIFRKKDSMRNGPVLERLVRFIFSTCGSMVSPNSISKELGYSESKTVDSYLSMLEEALIVYRADRYDLVGKKMLHSVCKYYCVDTGMRNAVLSTHGADLGRMLENVVYLELRRRGYSVSVGVMHNGVEVDFVAVRGGDTAYFQVTLSMADERVRERELRSLAAIRDNHPKTVLSADRLIVGGYDGIEHKNVIDFLLDRTG
ncbi:MAG: ATP-binding protein [Candidatus Methanoplasma sp.]|jgi:predicted AAA+ superfamily ATPase|nr:ATP-binding protein [Candidatus Methanoplasma sp.]